MRLASQRLRIHNPLQIITLLMSFGMGTLVGLSCQDKGEKQQANPPTDTPTVTPVMEKGSIGTEPPKSTPVARRITGIAPQYKGTSAPCDDRRQVEVELSQVGVPCSKYDFTALNNEAQTLADAELDKMKCPVGGPRSFFNLFGQKPFLCHFFLPNLISKANIFLDQFLGKGHPPEPSLTVPN